MAMSDKNVTIGENNSIFAVANSYTQKYYLNPIYKGLPEDILEEVQKICVAFVEECGGILALRFAGDGLLTLNSTHDESDYYYDDISAGLISRRIERENEELFEALGNYYRVKYLDLPPVDEE